jgi:hypothetical protein
VTTPSTSEAFALNIIVPGVEYVLLFKGEVKLTVGAILGLLTAITIISVSEVSPVLSVAFAVIKYDPAFTSFHWMLYGAVAVAPILLPFAKNSTWLIVPSASEAIAVKMIFEGAIKVPRVREVRLIVGAIG